jgi:hypothetical protein
VATSQHQFTTLIPAQSVTTFILTNVTLLPQIIGQASIYPTGLVTLYPGTSPVLSLSVMGSQLLRFQWTTNGVPVSGATNSTCILSAGNLTGTNDYACVISNFVGSTTTAVWSVSIIPSPFTYYPQQILDLHPVGYWRLNETPDNGSGNQGVVCHDYVGGNNGVFSNTVLARTGYSPVADPAGTAASFGSVLSTNSAVSQIGNIDFSAPPGGNGEFSITAWVNGGAQTSDAGIVSKGYGGGGEQFNLDAGSDSLTSHGFRFFVRDAFGNTHGASTAIAPDGNWHFLAAVCDESNGIVQLYVDGVSSAVGAISPGTAILTAPAGSVPGASLVSIGSRAAAKTSTSFTNQFLGAIDEVAIFNYALSSSQVQALYAAAPVPVVRASVSGGSSVITYTGTLLSSTNVNGPFASVAGATSPYPMPAAGPINFYRTSNP